MRNEQFYEQGRFSRKLYLRYWRKKNPGHHAKYMRMWRKKNFYDKGLTAGGEKVTKHNRAKALAHRRK